MFQGVVEPDAMAILPVFDATREIRFAYQAKAYKTEDVARKCVRS
jgi:hypothetical protein